MIDISNLSFCESVTASSRSPWHLRRLTDVGRKLGGGVDTGSLCGTVQPGKGWDLEGPVTDANVIIACPRCLLVLRRTNG